MAIIDNVPGSAASNVLIDGDGVFIQNLYTTDCDVRTVVADSEDPEEAVQHCLAIGARTTRLVQTTVDTAV